MKNLPFLRSFSNASSITLLLSNILLILFIGFVDYYTGYDFSFSIFYMLPISIVSWYGGEKAGIIASIISAIVWFVADVAAGHKYSSTLILIWNTIMSLGLFVIISSLLSNFKVQINKLYQKELTVQKNHTIIETFQQLTIVIVDNITTQNAEIIKWVNEKKNKKNNVPVAIEKSSQVIGASLQILSEVSFVSPYLADSQNDADKYLDVLKKRLTQVRKDLYSDDKKIV